MAKFPSTLLPETNDPLEIKKAVLDLLDKINKVSSESSALPAGTITMHGAATAPAGFLLCDGSAYRRVDYPALFAAIGATFGAPDAAQFNVPDFRGVSPTGVGAQDINARTKTGPALGEVREDGFQTHGHRIALLNSAVNGNPPYVGMHSAGIAATADTSVTIPVAIGGVTPRTGAYTHGPEIGINFIIKAG